MPTQAPADTATVRSTSATMSRLACWLVFAIFALPAEAALAEDTGPAPPEPVVVGQPRLSHIAIPIHIPIAAIRRELQARVPSDQSGGGSGGNVCKRLFGLKICVPTRYDYHLQRTGNVTVEPAAAGLQFGVPVTVTGHGGLNGPDAKALHLDARSFRAAANVSVAVGLRPKPDWCFETPADVHYTWTEPPRVEIAAGIWVDVEPLVRKQLDQRVSASAKRIAESIPCGEIQAALRRVWRIHVLPLAMPGVPNLALVMDPRSLGVSELSMNGGTLKIVVAGDVLTSLSTTPPTSFDKGPLPAPMSVSNDADRASVRVAIALSYPLLRTLVLQAASRPVVVHAGVLSGEVTMTDIAFAQAGRKLAADITYRLGSLGSDRQPSGIVHLEGVPSVTSDGRSIVLNDASVAPGPGQALDPIVAAALNGILREVLSRRALVDLGPRLDALAATLDGLSTDPAKARGLTLAVSGVRLRLGDIAVGAHGLAGSASAEGDVAADLAGLRRP